MATMHSVTDRQTDRRTDNMNILIIAIANHIVCSRMGQKQCNMTAIGAALDVDTNQWLTVTK